MKIKITRSNGTVIEAEGTAEECERLLAAEPNALAPITVTAPAPAFVPFIAPWFPRWPGDGPVYTTPTIQMPFVQPPNLPWDVTITAGGLS